MNKLILLSLMLASSVVIAEGLSFEPNSRITTSGYVDGKFQSQTTTVDGSGKHATTSGYVDGKFQSLRTDISPDGKRATTSGYIDGQFQSYNSTINK